MHKKLKVQGFLSTNELDSEFLILYDIMYNYWHHFLFTDSFLLSVPKGVNRPFSADVLTRHRRKSTGVTDYVNYGCVPSLLGGVELADRPVRNLLRLSHR